MSGAAIVYWARFSPGRSLWISALLVILLTLQVWQRQPHAFASAQRSETQKGIPRERGGSTRATTFPGVFELPEDASPAGRHF